MQRVRSKYVKIDQCHDRLNRTSQASEVAHCAAFFSPRYYEGVFSMTKEGLAKRKANWK